MDEHEEFAWEPEDEWHPMFRMYREQFSPRWHSWMDYSEYWDRHNEDETGWGLP